MAEKKTIDIEIDLEGETKTLKFDPTLRGYNQFQDDLSSHAISNTQAMQNFLAEGVCSGSQKDLRAVIDIPGGVTELCAAVNGQYVPGINARVKK